MRLNLFRHYQKREIKNAYTFLLPVLLVTLLFIAWPVIGTFWNSLLQDASYSPPKQSLVFENYIRLLADATFWRALTFTLKFTVVAVFFESSFGLLFALLLNESFPGGGMLRAVILIPWAIATIVSAQIWKLLYDYNSGVINLLAIHLHLISEKVNWMGTANSAFWALVIADVWKTTPFVIIILLAGLQAIDPDIYKQATIDGARVLKRFYKITLPLLRPVLLIAVIFRTIDSIRIFDLVYVLTSGAPGGSTETLSFIGFNFYTNNYLGIGSAVSVLTFLISFLITLLYIWKGEFYKAIDKLAGVRQSCKSRR